VNVLLVLGALWLGSTLPLCGAIIYSNSFNDLSVRFDPGTTEVGDEILLASTERYLTTFDFEFWGTNSASPANLTFAGAVEARVRFYVNDGTLYNGYVRPGTMFYDSGWFSVSPTPRSILSFNAGSDLPSGGLFIPTSDMTWSVQFRGMDSTDTVGVDLYSPPEVGQNYPDYWENDGGRWTLLTNTVPMDFGARMWAEIPEPSVATLSIIGGLGILSLARRLRRTS
jgi:hypothetical protein